MATVALDRSATEADLLRQAVESLRRETEERPPGTVDGDELRELHWLIEAQRSIFSTQLRDFGRVLREQWWLVLLCTLLAGAAALAYVETRPRTYEASARLLLQQDNVSGQIVGISTPGLDPVRQAATDQQLATSGTVAARVTKRLHLTDLSALSGVHAG